MKKCPRCGAALDDRAQFCNYCGAVFGNPNVPSAPVNFMPYDHTAEYDPADISKGKIYAMLPYLMGIIGVFIALLASNQSPFVEFHIRQYLKFTAVRILAGIVTVLTFWLVLPMIALPILLAVLYVIQIMTFFSVCSGKAKEPAIIRDLKFLS